MTEKRKNDPPFKLDMGFNEALDRYAQTKPEEITQAPSRNKALVAKMPAKEITPSQGELALEAEKEVEGIGMGVLTDGTPYLNQRGLAALCGVQNAHIGTISSQWGEREQKPRITAIKSILAKSGSSPAAAHIEVRKNGVVHFCYPAEVCLAVLEYYAFDAGANCQPEARDNFRLLAGSKLRELIFSQLGYDPTGRNVDRFKSWHDRIALNYQSAPRGYFHVFNEAHTIIYEMVQAGAKIGDKFVVDISVGQHWSKYWTDHELNTHYGERCTYPHRYPDTHPQAKSNPQESWCYPLASLGAFRTWLQDTYIEGGKFSTYLKGKVSRGELPPSVAQLAIATLVPAQLPAPPR